MSATREMTFKLLAVAASALTVSLTFAGCGSDSSAPVPPKTGTVTGTVTFHGSQAPTLITLSVPGTAVTGAPAVDGNYSLVVPVGTWDLVASAPNFKEQTLGRLLVQEGATTVVKPSTMSWYVPVYETDVAISAVNPLGYCSGGPWTGISMQVGSDQRVMFINTKTLERRQVASGSVSGIVFSSKCKYAAFILNSVLMVYEVGTANLQAWGAGAASPMDFSTDESTLFVTRYGAVLAPPPLGLNPGLERINLVAGTSTGFVSAVGGVRKQTSDRFFVVQVSDDVRLVTPTTDAVVFNVVKAGGFSTSPTAWALTNCAAGGVACSLKVLAPNGTTPNTVTGTYDTASVIYGSTGDWIGFSLTAGVVTTWKLVRGSDATSVAFPDSTDRLFINPDGTRIAYRSIVLTLRPLYEEPLPATGSVAPFATPTVFLYPTWLSNTRLVVYDPNPVNKVYEVKSGTLTTDTDVAVPTGASMFCASGSVAVYAQAAAAKWKVLFEDAAPLLVDGPNISPTSGVTCGARALVAGQTATAWGAFSIDEVSTYIVDGAGNQVRRQFIGHLGSGGWSSEGLDFFMVNSYGTPQSMYLPATGQLIQWFEPGRNWVDYSPDPVAGFYSLALDPTGLTLYVARFWR
jgi:hypothetical protein